MTDGPDPWAAPDYVHGGPRDYGRELPPQTRRGSRRGVWIGGVMVLVLALAVAGAALISTRSHASHASAVRHSASPPTTASSKSPAPSSSSPAPTPSATAGPALPALTPAPTSAPGPLDKYLLAPADIAPGTLMILLAGGRSATDQATLDFCNFTYASEADRTGRVQVQYFSQTSNATSNEFVQYKAGGAAKAFTEIQQAVQGCPASSQTGNYSYSLIERAPTQRALAPRQLVISFQVSDKTGGTTLPWQAAAYQFNGAYFSGVYVYGQSRAAVLTQVEQLAAAAAHHLSEAAAGKPGTGGGPLLAPSSQGPDNGVPA